MVVTPMNYVIIYFTLADFFEYTDNGSCSLLTKRKHIGQDDFRRGTFFIYHAQ